MAESTGIFIEVDLDENVVKKLLNQKFENAPFGKKLGYYFSELLYDRNNNPEKVFIFHYDKKEQKCFIAYLMNYFNEVDISHFPKILEMMSTLKNTNTTNYAVVMTTFPEVLWGYKITKGVNRLLAENIPQDKVAFLSEKFWSFSENNDFPEPQKALKKRGYFYKSFKNYYKKYLAYVEESLKPQKIAKATKENPYHLFDEFYTYDYKVYEFRTYTNQVIELPKADPLSFRNVAHVKADKNFVFKQKLAVNSPPKSIKKGNFTVNNPKAIWEWHIVDGVHGGSFEYIKEKWDTIYYRDKDNIFYGLKKIAADRNTFEYLDFCFGRDKNHVFCYDSIIPIDTNSCELSKNGFICDQENIFHFDNQIPLDAKTFKVLECIKGTYKGVGANGHPINGTFVLEDKYGKYEYNKDWEQEKIKLITNKPN